MATTEIGKSRRLLRPGLKAWWRESSRPARERAKADRKRLRARRALVWGVIAFFCAIGYWASQARLDEVVRGQGQVIPDSSTQVIQSLEGGIVKEIPVREGVAVKTGDLLVKLHDTQFAAAYDKEIVTRNLLRSRLVRLLAEGEGRKTLEFPEDLINDDPELVRGETILFEARMRDQGIEAKFISERLGKQRQMLDLMKPAILKGTVSQLESLRMESEINQLEGQLATLDSKFVRDAMEKFDVESAELKTLEETLEALRDRRDRTAIFSPIDGIVNAIFIDTAERVIAGGEAIMEVVPQGDDLLVEAKLRPQDIAFIHQDQLARVRFTAFDPTIYGSLEGKVETIGVDTMTTEQGDIYYPIKIRTDKTSLGVDPKTGSPLLLVPGMVAEVDIITGSKTLLDYLLKPINRARIRAFREP